MFCYFQVSIGFQKITKKSFLVIHTLNCFWPAILEFIHLTYIEIHVSITSFSFVLLFIYCIIQHKVSSKPQPKDNSKLQPKLSLKPFTSNDQKSLSYSLPFHLKKIHHSDWIAAMIYPYLYHETIQNTPVKVHYL